MNRKFARTRPSGCFDIRVFHRSRKAKKDPRFLFKCGCCEGQVEVYYGDDSLEINGVMGSVENWRELLLPLLNMALPGQEPQKRPRSSAAKAKRSGATGAQRDGYTEAAVAMTKYLVVLERTEEGFSVGCPGLPGCWSQGVTEQEGLENIRTAIQKYVRQSGTRSKARRSGK